MLLCMFTTWTARRLLKIKNRDQTRQWRRKNSFVIAQANQTEALSNQDDIFSRNRSFTGNKIESGNKSMDFFLLKNKSDRFNTVARQNKIGVGSSIKVNPDQSAQKFG